MQNSHPAWQDHDSTASAASINHGCFLKQWDWCSMDSSSDLQLPTVHRFIAKCWSYATCHVYLKCIRDNGSWRDLPPKTLQHLKSSRIGSQRISKEKAVYPPSREDATMKPILNTLQKKKQLWKTLKNNRSIQTPIQPRPLFNELAERPRSHQSWGTRSLLAFLQNPPHPLLSWPYIAG